ncbi:response regulator transcription factor [Oleiharenicola lentus]|jgi:two-component system alkaline phosphatase synthesis response regulator PhoP|uniref:Response regulator transcription factor n=1 Tax=Oleiharenicola lentus TaxID=2508720 RepID=A0A4Q1CCD5_9BACT|nr:response regulator transcription factor [Oleiharenicola lentus]RXK56708.1 response regulator transcription factor [Oleiharenicola lentus]
MCAEPRPLIVVVEDELELAQLIAQHLEEAGMNVQTYQRVAPALRFLQNNFANLILLDVNLPDGNGFELIKELKAQDINTPVIFVTANTHDEAKIQGLNLGGDDYITKPFSYTELVARIRAVLRRTEGHTDFNVTKNLRTIDGPFEFLGAKVHPERLEIEFPNGTTFKTGRKELGIIAYLHLHRNIVITRKELIHSVWGIHADIRSRSLDQYIVKVRAAFDKNGVSLDCFKTVHGIGYIFEPPASAS